MSSGSARREAAVVATGLGVAAAALLVGAATATAATVVEAESFPAPTGESASSGDVIADASAHGGEALRFARNGTTALPVTLPLGSRYLRLRARGTPCDGRPEIVLGIDERPAISAVLQRDWRLTAVPYRVGRGAHTLELSFATDHERPPQCDRAAIVDRIVFSNTPPAPAPEVELDTSILSSPFFIEELHAPETLPDPGTPSDEVWYASTVAGAVWTNASWEQGTATKWNISLQRAGEQYITAGIARSDPELIENGLLLFDWGFAQQAADGSFPGTKAPVHNTSGFVRAVAHMVLLLERSPYALAYADRLADLRPRLHDAARWLVSEPHWSEAAISSAPFNHRHYLKATGLGLAAKATGDDSLMPFARQMLRAGLPLQQPDGCNLEKSGCDTGYQTSGLRFAETWIVHFPNEPLTPSVEEMLERGLAWEASRIEPDGRINTDGNTRTCADEAPQGEVKEPHYGVAVLVFAYWADLRDLPEYLELAQRVRQYEESGLPQCPPT